MRWCPVLLVLFLSSKSPNNIQKSPTKENLRGVSAVSERVVWASGTHGSYLSTTNGGITWQVAQVPGAEDLDFRDVAAFDSSRVYLLSAGPGEQSRIYKTTDGGLTWTLQFTNKDPKGFFDCMAFWDSERGIVLGDPVPDSSGKLRFELITTDDGGQNWKPLPDDARPVAIEGEAAFAASGTCIAAQGKGNAWFATGGKAARVFRSPDGGKSWTGVDTPIVHGTDSAGIFSIAFRDNKHGAIAGGDYKNPQQSGANLAFSNDGGRTWKLSNFSPQAYFSAVAFDRSKNHLFALGPVFTLAISKIEKKKVSEQELNAISVAPNGEAFAVGAKGVIVSFRPIR
jgi:photosystem II stability/assembly factor-like uncharacterized protein